MIYQPAPVFDFRVAIGQGVVLASLTAIEDFVAGSNKPWEYYVGVGIGGAAAATGIPGAAATVYVVCDSVDVWLFHSPQGSQVRTYIDGIADAAIDTSLGPLGWIKHSITGLGAIKRNLTFVNGLPGLNNLSGISWLAISQIQVNNGIAENRTGGTEMANASVTYTIQDADGDVKSLPIIFPRGTLTLAQIDAFASAYAPLLDAVLDAQIVGISTSIDLAIPNGLKSSAASGTDVERGALFTFNAANTPYVWSAFLPGFATAKFSGDEVNKTDSAVAALIGAMVSGLTNAGATVSPSDKYGNDLTALKAAVKRFRK